MNKELKKLLENAGMQEIRFNESSLSLQIQQFQNRAEAEDMSLWAIGDEVMESDLLWEEKAEILMSLIRWEEGG